MSASFRAARSRVGSCLLRFLVRGLFRVPDGTPDQMTPGSRLLLSAASPTSPSPGKADASAMDSLTRPNRTSLRLRPLGRNQREPGTAAAWRRPVRLRSPRLAFHDRERVAFSRPGARQNPMWPVEDRRACEHSTRRVPSWESLLVAAPAGSYLNPSRRPPAGRCVDAELVEFSAGICVGERGYQLAAGVGILERLQGTVDLGAHIRDRGRDCVDG